MAFTLALVGPYFIDWTSYRADFEREASLILGRQVKVEGDATARLLPFPSVTFSDVRVAGTDEQPAMTVETFSMDAELAPFLSGEVLIFDMRLVRPRAVIRVGEDGAIDWAVRPSTPVDPRHIRLEKLTVTEGAVSVLHAPSGRTHRLTEINADISARTFAGPWRLEGAMRLDGMLTDLEASTGTLDENGALRLRMRAKPQRYPLTVELDGDATIRDGSGRYDGTFRVAAFDEEPKEAADAANGPADYRLAGRFALDHRRLAVEEFRFETGPVADPYTADGTAEIEIGGKPRFQVTATGAQLHFDDSVTEGEGTPGLTLAQRIEALKRFVVALPLPAMAGRVDVILPALVAGDTTFRDVRLSAEPAEDGWKVGEFAASLPGRTTLEASGMVKTADEDARFEGEMLLAIGQPSGFAAWLARDVDAAIRRLPAAGFAAKVELSSERQEFRDLELALGDAKFGGHIEHLTAADARPALLAELGGGELDVEGLAAFASLFVSDAGASRFADRDLDLKVAAGPVNIAGLTAARIDTALRLKEARLDIDRLAITDLAGTNLSATGAVTDFPANPSGNIDASILASDLGPLATLLGERFPDNRLAQVLARRFAAFPGLGLDARIDLAGTSAREGEGQRFAISASGEAGGSAFSLAYSGDGMPLRPKTLDLNYSARNDDAGPILALYGLPALPLPVAGEARTELTITGSPHEGMSASLRVHGETAEATFDGNLTPLEESYTAQGRASLVGADLAPALTAMGVALPGSELGLGVGLTSDIRLADGALHLANLAGTVADTKVSGDLTATAQNGVPHFEGRLATEELPADLAAALVLGQASLAPGENIWPQVPFPGRLTSPFTAELDIEAGSISMPGTILATDASFHGRLDGEGIAIADLDAASLGGRLTGLLDIRNNGGTGLFTTQAHLKGADVPSLPGAGGPAGKGDFSASLNASGKSVGGLVASLSGTGTARLGQLTIAGLNGDPMAGLIAAADAAGRDIDAAAVDRFAPDLMRRGELAVRPFETAFTVAGGVVRTAPFELTSDHATARAELRADLSEWRLGLEGEVAYDPGQEALVGSEPSVRFVVSGSPEAAEVRLDMQPMAQFLTQRALEIEQARVEAMQAELLEKQRLRREVRYYAALQQERERVEAERLAAEEAARVKAEEETRLKAEEEARLKAEEEARAKAEEEARARAEEDARRQAEEDARRKAEEEERRREMEERTQQPAQRTPPAGKSSAPTEPAAPDMAGRPPLVAPVERPIPPAEVAPRPRSQRPAEGGFSLESLFRSFGSGD